MTEKNGNTNSQESWRVPLLGFKIEKKADFIALTAFILSLITGFYQFFGYYNGAQVVLFQPPQVTIIFSTYSDGISYVRLGARMAYVNKGHVGYNAALANERVSFTLDRTYEQTWQEFKSFSYDSNKRVLIPHFISDAHPEPIPAGSAVSHETYFAPHPVHCHKSDTNCIKWKNLITKEKFLNLLGTVKTLEFKFQSDIYGERSVYVTCTLAVDSDLVGNLAINEYTSQPCLPS